MTRHFAQLTDIADRYDHIVISPHLDDAALSCGGCIARYTRQRQRVLVVNVCTGMLPRGMELSPFAQYIMGGWRLDYDRAIQMRQREDRAAMKILGADSCDLGFLDAIFRHPDAYNSLETMLGPLMPEDSLIAHLESAMDTLLERSPGSTLYVPLAFGMHVDHQVAYDVGRRLVANGQDVAFYEDLPYAAVTAQFDERFETLGGTRAFTPEIVAIDAVLRRKIGAIAAYRSQLQPLFGGRFVFRAKAKMRRRIKDFAARYGSKAGRYGERLWHYRNAM